MIERVNPRVREAETRELSGGELSAIRRLMDAAFGPRFSKDDWEHALGGRHFLIEDPDGDIACHAAVVPRTLVCSGQTLATGYVEAVATLPGLQGRGLGSAAMAAVARHIRETYRIGALSGDPGFYGRRGWQVWRGPTWCRLEHERVRTPEEDGGVLVLPTPTSPPLNLDADISVEWRPGDVW